MISDSIKSESSINVEDILSKNNQRISLTNKQVKKDEELEQTIAADAADESHEQDKHVEDGMNYEEFVPFRSYLKEESIKQWCEVMKKMDSEARRAAYEEKLKQASDKEKNLLQSHAMRKKEQKEHASKMSTVPGIIGLPKGLTLRDDAMTKANVFLRSKPPLR